MMAILTLSSLLILLASCGKEKKVENKVVFGSVTELSGDFRWPGFGGASAGSADQDINRLTRGYGTMEIDQSGRYVWNGTVVRSHSARETAEGDYEITVTIREGLQFSDGSPITAANYLVDTLVFSSPIASQAGHTAMAGQTLVGFDAFRKYGGEGHSAEGARRELAGLRLIDDYTFSLTVSREGGFYPYYFVESYGALTPSPLSLAAGEGVFVKDDGEGAYLTDAFYETEGEVSSQPIYRRAEHLRSARYDVSEYPYSGPYTVARFDKSAKECTLVRNPYYQGNFEGQRPAIETLVYLRIVPETQLQLLESGGIDILSNITGGSDTKAALDMMNASDGRFAEVHYQRAGYGKIQFECDFGPTSFTEVRQAVAYLLDRAKFARVFTGGYGGVVHGPYSPDFTMWQAIREDIVLNSYEYSLLKARQTLEGGGWIYNDKGEPFVEGASGASGVRYKKLTKKEAEASGGVNKTYRSVANTDGIEYKTVKIGDDYYMPLVINWFGTADNEVTELLSANLAENPDVKRAGMVIRATTGNFTTLMGNIYRDESYGYLGTPTYGMFNLATGWNTAVYDYAFSWSLDPDYFSYSANKLYDAYDRAFPYYDGSGRHTRLSFDEAMAASGGKLGMDYLSMAMVYDAESEADYNRWWQAYIERFNALLPDIPLYSNYYYDVYNAKIENYRTTPFFGMSHAILYASVRGSD